MRRLGIALFVSLMMCGASSAWAQYGMYGSPDVLPVQQIPAQSAAATPYQSHQAGAQYQYPAPATQTVAWTAPADQPALVQPMPATGPSPVTQPSRVYVPTPHGSSVTNQMMAEQGNGCVGGGNGCGDCGQGACCGPCCDRLWYASLSALVLNRSSGRRLWTSSEYPNESIQIANTDFPMAWSWGGEVQLGRRFCCDCTPYALEATFWTTTALTGSQTSTSTLGDGVRIATPLEIGHIDYPLAYNTIDAATIFNNALTSTVSRRDEFYNVEVNLIRERMAWCCDSSWEIGWSLGVRYFRFQESLSVGAMNPDITFGDPVLGPIVGDAYFNDTVTNNLVGPQIGFDLAYRIGGNVRLFISPKFGIYGNWVDSNFQAKARQGAGEYVDAINTVNADYGVTNYPGYPAHGANTGLAFLTQIDLGLDWQFTQNWSAKIGYRVVAMTGVGLADDEFPQYLCDTPEMQNPQHNSSLVLHGAFVGVTYNF
jgi:hypothetical protein